MRYSDLSIHLSFAVLSLTLVSACGGGSESTTEPTVTPTSLPIITTSPTPSTTPTPTPSPTTVLDCGDISGTVVNNNLDANAKAYFLCKHNETRSRVALGTYTSNVGGNLPVATNMIRLQWDTNLEHVAQNYANQCIWDHNPDRQNQYNALSPTDINGDAMTTMESVGENLAYYGQSNATQATMERAIYGYDGWEDEGLNYSFGALQVNDYCADEPCGHFTQLIWANTYKVGCAVSFCAAGTVSAFPSTLLVCNYASAGNVVPQYPYETGSSSDDVCNTANSGQTVCANGLTQSSEYDDGLHF